MKPAILILGSGKMARNIGLFFLKNSHPVAWLSEKKNYLVEVDRFLIKEIKRIKRYNPESSQKPDYSLHSYNEVRLPSAEIIIESTKESPDKKRTAIRVIEQRLKDKSILLFSNSSSILPQEIHPSCIGCHFFYPLELCCIAEVIIPSSVPERVSSQAVREIENWGLRTILQSEKNAFAVNRLLLPLQAEVFRLLGAGYDPQTINTASVSKLLPVGQLSLMDAIGLDTIKTSVDNYVKRMPRDNAPQYYPLQNGLSKLITMGKSGNKNKNGLLCGELLPWPIKKPNNAEDLPSRFCDLFLNTCRLFISTNQISASDLDLAFSSIFHSDVTSKDSV